MNLTSRPSCSLQADSDVPPDSDLLLLLSNTVSLLSSSSPAVILSTVRLHHILSPPTSPLPHLLPPLLRILASHPEEGVRLAVLESIRVLLRERKDIFEDDEELGDLLWTRFVVGVGDGRRVCLEKIGMLVGLVAESNVKALVREFLVSRSRDFISVFRVSSALLSPSSSNTSEVQTRRSPPKPSTRSDDVLKLDLKLPKRRSSIFSVSSKADEVSFPSFYSLTSRAPADASSFFQPRPSPLLSSCSNPSSSRQLRHPRALQVSSLDSLASSLVYRTARLELV